MGFFKKNTWNFMRTSLRSLFISRQIGNYAEIFPAVLGDFQKICAFDMISIQYHLR